jgi:hypothetical protein
MNVPEVCAALGYPRARVYGLINRGPQAGGIFSIKEGKARRVPAWALDLYIRQKLEAQGQQLPTP